jgi:hypothetical protein
MRVMVRVQWSVIGVGPCYPAFRNNAASGGSVSLNE